MEIKFKYALDTRVITPFGRDGIVTMAAVDDGGIKYFVRTAENSDWHKECELSLRNKSE